VDLHEFVVRLGPSLGRIKLDYWRKSGPDCWELAADLWLSPPLLSESLGVTMTAPTIGEAEVAVGQALCEKLRDIVLTRQQALGRQTADLAGLLLLLETAVS